MHALITGASSGIGYEFAHILAEDDYDLTLVARNKERLLEIKKELPTKVTLIVADLAKPGVAKMIASKVKHVDVLINNAGFGEYGMFLESKQQRNLDMIQVNITTLTDLTRTFLERMVRKGKGGKILNVASTAAFQPGPLMAVYYATKAYVLSFSEALANELKDTGVTVTALCPGPTASKFQSTSGMGQSRLVKGKKLPTAHDVAAYGYQAMLNGRVVAIHGMQNKLLRLSTLFVPRNIVTGMVRYLQEKR